MPKTLDKKLLLKMFNEELEKRSQTKSSYDDEKRKKPKKKVDIDVERGGSVVISPGLVIKHKDSGRSYTVDSIKGDDVYLKKPEGQMIIIPRKELEDLYTI